MRKPLILLFCLLSLTAFAQKGEIFYSEGTELLNNNEYEKAFKAFGKAEKHNANIEHPDIYLLQGICSFNRYRVNSPKHKETINLFTQYIEENPMDPKGYLRRAIVNIGVLKKDLALKDLKQCISLNPCVPSAYYYYASASTGYSSAYNPEIEQYYSIFISLIDSTHQLYKSAHHNRGVNRLKKDKEMAESDFIIAGSNQVKIARYVFPIGLQDYDTTDYCYYDGNSLVQKCGVLVPENSEEKYITVTQLNKSTKLSDILNVDQLETYHISVFSETHNNKGEIEIITLEATCNNDLFNDEVLQLFQNLNLGDKIVFQIKVYADETKQQLKPMTLSYSVKTTCANPT